MARGLPQWGLAKLADLHVGQLSRIEHDYYKGMRAVSLLNIADALGVGTDWLLGRTDVDYYAEGLKKNKGIGDSAGGTDGSAGECGLLGIEVHETQSEAE